MTLCRDYMFILDNKAMEGSVFAYHGSHAKDPQEYIGLLENCDKSRIQGITMIPPDATGNINISEKCKVHIVVSEGIVSITIESRHTEKILYEYEGRVDDFND